MLSRSHWSWRTRRVRCLLGLVVVASAAHAGRAQGPSTPTAGPLRVIGRTPDDSGRTSAVITVMFDRPVAGMLDRSVDPARILHVTPAIPGAISWRDPATIRLIPAKPLTPGDAFDVVVDTNFTAMDGSRLAEPYRFRVRIPGPRVLAAIPGVPNWDERWTDTFRLIVSAPLDSSSLDKLRDGMRVSFRNCPASPVSFRAASQAPVRPDESWHITNARATAGDTAADAFRRIVGFVPATPLPENCQASWYVPSIDPNAKADTNRFDFDTRPRFAVVSERSCSIFCSRAQIPLTFSTPVRPAQLAGKVTITPAVDFTLHDGEEWRPEARRWSLSGRFHAGASYTVHIAPTVHDVLGRTLGPDTVFTYRFGDALPQLSYTGGLVNVSRTTQSIRLRHVNTDTVRMVVKPLRGATLARALSGPADSAWFAGLPDSVVRVVPLAADFNEERESVIPVPAAGEPGDVLALVVRAVSTLQPPSRNPRAVVTTSSASYWRFPPPVTLLQRTALTVHAKVGDEKSVMFVTAPATGQPVVGASVDLRDSLGAVVGHGTTNRDGLAEIAHPPLRLWSWGADGRGPRKYIVDVSTARDRISVPVNAVFYGDPFVNAAGLPLGEAPLPGSALSDRAIYRPGEIVHLHAIARTGILGALRSYARSPVRLVVTSMMSAADTVHRATLTSSDFGAVADSFAVEETARLGPYHATFERQFGGEWLPFASTDWVVAEYRAPEFTVAASIDSAVYMSGDTIRVGVSSQYLFGAPMAGGRVEWTMSGEQARSWQIKIPRTEGYVVAGWSYDAWSQRPRSVPFRTGVDSLTRNGTATVKLVPRLDSLTGPALVDVTVQVVDANRQPVATTQQVLVHASSLYLAMRDRKTTWYWRRGVTDSIDVIAVRPNGDRVAGVNVAVHLVRERWLWKDGRAERVVDTVRSRSIVTRSTPVSLKFTPDSGGTYAIRLSARDERRRATAASLYEYVASPQTNGPPLRLSVTGPRDTLRAGDTATVAYVNPFPRAEAWITVEREQVIEQRRVQVSRGSQEIRLPVRDAYASNVFVSVTLVNQRSAESADTLASLVRVGQAVIRVSAEGHRLDVALSPMQRSSGPGDSAVIDLRLTDHKRPARGEAVVWAVDEGVLSLTGYRTPSPLASMYAERGVGSLPLSGLRWNRTAAPPLPPLSVSLEMNVSTSASRSARAIPVSEESPGEVRPRSSATAVTPRSDFRTTAFFIGHVVSDDSGRARIRVKMPDNLTTYRLMAAAATDDRFGSAQDSLLVTRSVVVRPSLPRFVRQGDSVYAGATINVRDGMAQRATMSLAAPGVAMQSPATTTLDVGAQAKEARWHFAVANGDTASRLSFNFAAAASAGADAVSATIPLRPAGVPRSHTIAGAARGTTDVEFLLPPDVDLNRSRVVLETATSPLSALKWAYRYLRSYPYDCTEQLASSGHAMVATYRVRQLLDSASLDALFGNRPPLEAIRAIANEIVRRQDPSGGFRYWPTHEWTSIWLTTYAADFLLEARELGVDVDSAVFGKVAKLVTAWSADSTARDTLVGDRESRGLKLRSNLAQRVAAAEFLRRAGRPSIALEDDLVRFAGRMSWEDRLVLAEVIAPRDRATATSIVDAAWQSAPIVGRRVDLADSTHGAGDFPSHVRPAARLLTATLAVRPGHPSLGALLETMLQLGSAERAWAWNTQDYSAAIVAAARLTRAQASVSGRGVTVYSTDDRARHAVLARSSAATADTVRSLAGLTRKGNGWLRIPLTVAAGDDNAPLYFALTVTEVPTGKSVLADRDGLLVERWYERYDDGTPVTSVEEGDLVRVRLRVSAPSDRAFVALDDALPAGLEAVDLSLRTSALPGPFAGVGRESGYDAAEPDQSSTIGWLYGRWDGGWWTPWENRELRDDRVVYFARMLWKGRYEASYVARATTAGTFVLPPARAEEMYNPALQGRSVGGTFVVRERR